jgi:hypothetical protein
VDATARVRERLEQAPGGGGQVDGPAGRIGDPRQVTLAADRQRRAMTVWANDRGRAAGAVTLDRRDVALAVLQAGEPAARVVGELEADRGGAGVARA